MQASSASSNTEEHAGRRNEGGGSNEPVPMVKVELDDFGLPIRQLSVPNNIQADSTNLETLLSRTPPTNELREEPKRHIEAANKIKNVAPAPQKAAEAQDDSSASENDEFKDAPSTPAAELQEPRRPTVVENESASMGKNGPQDPSAKSVDQNSTRAKSEELENSKEANPDQTSAGLEEPIRATKDTQPVSGDHQRTISKTNGISEWSHQQIVPQQVVAEKGEEDEWQVMPAFAPFDIYDDNNKLVAKEAIESDDEAEAYGGLGGAGKGYTRVQLDEDAQSATSLDENTQYLFREINGTSAAGLDDEEERDAVSQMQATKDLLTEGQRIAYVGMTRLTLSVLVKETEALQNRSKHSKKETALAVEAIKMWGQKMMVRLYTHMDISAAEQVMVEQLAEHGVIPMDLTPTLMQNARVKNPMAENESPPPSMSSPRPLSVSSMEKVPRLSVSSLPEEEPALSPPPYVEHEGEDLPKVRTPSQLPTSKNIDIDLRWTVLCDLFLTLIADSIYDARSRVLLERVGEHMNVPWTEICRFEKRVTDALEMQQAAEKENWNEDDHKEHRRKMALKKRYMMMGLATVGGGLVIGLSAGLLAPVIGAGLAAGFTTIGVAGTSGFLAGAGGAAIITSTAAASGGIIAVRAADRRTGAVKTFEYRPLHNNKRVNLIVTVSGWMTGKIDDVRLPYSTVDPIMGDIYSVLWEPEMLTSMGDTINILATEALTQGLQQVLGSTILVGLMAALQLPVVLTKLSYLIDNPWTVSLDRANSAGLILADSLIARNLGTRPITLVGYSLGSRLIFSCLKELAKRGAFGVVQNVYLFGSPMVANKDEYIKARAVVSGRFVNGFARNDWILGYLFRLTSGGISHVAGLAPVTDIPQLENVDVTELVPGHMAYRTAMPRLLREVGWLVESDEFSEIEDPDPEDHQKRQRELINEIEEARKDFEKKEKEKEAKGTFGFFGRKKKAVVDKKEWETYQESKPEHGENDEGQGSNNGVLFDIDAIRAELAQEHLEVRELKSTLPPMKLDFDPLKAIPATSRSGLRETKSFDESGINTSKPAALPSFPPPQNPASTRASKDLEPSNSDQISPYLHPSDGVRLSFDTAYHPPARSSTSSIQPTYPTPAPGPSSTPPLDFTSRTATLQRPDLRSSTTLPVMNLAGFDHNAWADDDDEFREKDMEMTFA